MSVAQAIEVPVALDMIHARLDRLEELAASLAGQLAELKSDRQPLPGLEAASDDSDTG